MGARPARRPPAGTGARIELLTNDALARLHPTGAHPEQGARLAALAELGGEQVERRATEEQVLRAHTRTHVDVLR
ncbi:MAG TPA: hypothetical protein VNT23_07140, partial [Gaiellaceae bacterium]|nr:hypothetical protein [Gaiellaceae bacterium]